MNAKIIGEGNLDTFLGQLEKSKLPYQDIRLDGNLFIAYHDDVGNLVGTGGLEFYSDCALLRSVSVTEPMRGMAFGRKIVDDLIDKAKHRSSKKILLLTETAPEFFKKIGFKIIPRETAPEQMKASSEFSSVCPVSAVCMELDLLTASNPL